MFNLFKKSDREIEEDVMNELKWDPRVTADGINVTAKDGIVTLRGTVPHYFEKGSAEDAAQRVGVTVGKSALDLLNERYALGELKQDEYQRIRSDMSALPTERPKQTA